MKEAVNEMFFTQVLGLPKPLKLKKNATLATFCRQKKFEKEYVDMLTDKIERVFNVSVKQIKNKSVSDILIFIEQRKAKQSLYRSY